MSTSHARPGLEPSPKRKRPGATSRVVAVVAAVTLVVTGTAAGYAASASTTGAHVVYLGAATTPPAVRERLALLATGPAAPSVRATRGLADGLALSIVGSATTPPAALATIGPLAFDPARVMLVEGADATAVAAAAARLVRDGEAEWAEPVVEREALDAPATTSMSPGMATIGAALPAGFPDDPLFRDGRQWGLFNTGALGGIAGADIRALLAWRHSCGAAWVRLAIADTGIDPGHPDLARALPGGPRIELGLDVTADSAGSWADSVAHGTAVAGVMAALTADGPHFDSLGMAGVCGGDGAASVTW